MAEIVVNERPKWGSDRTIGVPRETSFVLEALRAARFKRLARKTADERDEVSGETFRRLPVRGMTNARVSGEA